MKTSLLQLTISLIIFMFLLLQSEGANSEAKRQSGKIIGEGTEPAKIEITDPKGGWTVDPMLKVSGRISDWTVNPITININGSRYLLRVNGGNFSRKFPVTKGKNSVVIQGSNKSGLVKIERTVFASIPTVAIQAILTSDTDGIYTDLHVYEPQPGLKKPFEESETHQHHVFWAHTASPTGGKFYLNEQGGDYDQPGYGPYLYTHVSPPAGIYRIDANYWPSGDKAHTLANLNLVIFGGTPQEVRRSIKAPLAKPGETVTLAWVRIDKNQKGYVYSPVADEKPKDNKLWPAWVVNYIPKAGGSVDGDYY